MRVLAFTKYDRAAASTRVRLLQFVPALQEAGITVEHRPLLSDGYVRSLGGGQKPSRVRIAAAYAQRLAELLRKPQADLIWVYAELFPWLPAGFERLVHRSGVPVIYDWDDAFDVPYAGHRSALVRRLLGHKLEPLLRGAAAVTCGNEVLADAARTRNGRVLVVPSVVDTERYRPEPEPDGPPVIGWIGSPSTWANVRPLLPLLAELHRTMGARIRAVGAGSAASGDRFKGLELADWSDETEVAEVQGFTVGIMPLLDAPFERGKSGYKLVQYMACGRPAVASPVGVNASLLGEAGLLATSEAEWRAALTRLLGDAALRAKLGAAARERAVRDYSLASQAPRLINLFRSVV